MRYPSQTYFNQSGNCSELTLEKLAHIILNILENGEKFSLYELKGLFQGVIHEIVKIS